MIEQPAQQPATPEAATARLAELSSSPEFRSKIEAQDPAAFGEFQALIKTISGGTVEVAETLSAANNAKMTADFLAGPLPAGFPDLKLSVPNWLRFSRAKSRSRSSYAMP